MITYGTRHNTHHLIIISSMDSKDNLKHLILILISMGRHEASHNRRNGQLTMILFRISVTIIWHFQEPLPISGTRSISWTWRSYEM